MNDSHPSCSLPDLPANPPFSPLTGFGMIWGGSWQQGSTAAAKLPKRFILRFMQNSLCGDQGGLRFNIHADLEEMLITGLGNLRWRLILLLPAPLASPPALFSSSPMSWASSSPAGQVGLDSDGGRGLTSRLPGLSWPCSTFGWAGRGWAAVRKSYGSFWGILTGNR